MNQPRLRTRLALWFAASVLLILSPFLAGIAAIEWRAMRAALDHHLREDLEVAVEFLDERDGAIAWRGDLRKDLGYDAGTRRWVEVYSLDGRGLYFRGFPADESIRASLPPLSPSREGFQSFLTPAGAHVRGVSAHRRLGAIDAVVRVVRTEDDLRASFGRMALTFGVLAPLAVTIAALAGFVISGRMLSPIGRMAARARAISAENLSDRLPVGSSGDELDRLASVFNDTFTRLEASFGRLKQFTADVSHQFRTPLTAIRTVGEVGLREPRDPAAYQEIIGSMLEEADHLARVVDTLLTLSRWESRRVPLARAPVDLSALARDVASQLAVLAEERDVELDFSGLSLAIPLAADAVMLRQAVINVLDNAIKFTRPGTRVVVKSVDDGRELCLVVEDSGPGIPEDQRDRVLERFYRVHHDGAVGAGLGLAIVQWAVEANGGRLSIQTSSTGGARVVLAFPRT